MAANKIDEILKHFPDLEEGWKEMEERLKTEPAEREMLSLRYQKMLEMEKLKENLPEPEFTKAKRAEPAPEEKVEESDLEKAAKRYATEGDEISGLYIIDEEVDAFKAGAEWQKKQMIEQSLEAVREEFPDGTFIYSTKNLIDDDMEERGICLFDYLNVRIVLIQSV